MLILELELTLGWWRCVYVQVYALERWIQNAQNNCFVKTSFCWTDFLSKSFQQQVIWQSYTFKHCIWVETDPQPKILGFTDVYMGYTSVYALFNKLKHICPFNKTKVLSQLAINLYAINWWLMSFFPHDVSALPGISPFMGRFSWNKGHNAKKIPIWPGVKQRKSSLKEGPVQTKRVLFEI